VPVEAENVYLEEEILSLHPNTLLSGVTTGAAGPSRGSGRRSVASGAQGFGSGVDGRPQKENVLEEESIQRARG
jgi:hypothetical protein